MRISERLFAIIVVTSFALNVCLPAWAADVTGAGSTFVYPILAKWAEAYKKGTGLSINYQPIGSAGGIWLIKNKSVDFGASEAPLKQEELAMTAILQFPIVVGGVVPVVNLGGIMPGELKLTGPVLADIYLGKITSWKDKTIADLNPNLNLPDQAIVPVHRAADSGTRHIFDDYLAKVSAEWRTYGGGGFNRLLEFRGGVGSKGNDAVAVFVAATAGSIGYVEYAYVKQYKLAYVLMKNRDGGFVAPSNQTFESAVANAAQYMRLTDQAGEQSWPITGSTFVLAYKNQEKPEAAAEMLKFFDWAYRNGMTLVDDLDYAPIPQNVVELVERAWAEIKLSDGRPAWVSSTAIPR
jgi:phosphate transport system substrate-binding protein